MFLSSGAIEQGDWKRTIDHYCIIIYEHTMLVAGMFLFEKLKTCPIIKLTKIKLLRYKILHSSEHSGECNIL